MNEDGQPPGEVEKWGMRASVIGAPPHLSRLKRLWSEEWSRGMNRGDRRRVISPTGGR